MSVATLRRLLIVAFLLVVASATQAFAGVTGNISGHVTDDQGSPIAGAKVSVNSPSQSLSTLSDSHGFFSVLNLSPDTYNVTASKDGYDSATVEGVTVQTNQTAGVNVALRPSTKTLGRVFTTASASVVNKTVTGDLYSINAAAIKSYQGNAGGAETLYSQNGVVGSLPGVVRSVGSGGGYFGNGTLSFRGGSNDQVGFELEGIPLNRGFDAANASSFVTNGLASLEVYTGGEPADAGRSMSGYINEVIQRGRYPGGADFTGVIGSPSFNHTIQADIYGGTPDRRFTYFVSTLAVNSGYQFVDSSNLDNTSINVPANDAGCGAFNSIVALNTIDATSQTIDCTTSHVFNMPISQAAWQGFVNPYASIRDTVTNLHWGIDHNGLQDDLQALFVVGGTSTPFLYAGPGIDPGLYCEGVGFNSAATNCFLDSNNNFTWPFGSLYTGSVGQPYTPSNQTTLTWPSSGGGIGQIPKWYDDGQTTESSIEKLSYTRSLSQSSFLRLYAYMLYSTWNFDQATNGFLGDSFYQLHDHASGITANYQNQISSQHLLHFDVDYSKDLTLRYNYAPNFFPDFFTNNVECGTLSNPSTLAPCNPGDNVAIIGGPFAYWNDIGPINSDVALADDWKPSDKWLVDIGVRFDNFRVPLMPLQITGPNGLAEVGQNQFGYCLHGYAYMSTEPCFGFLQALQASNVGTGLFDVSPGAAKWTDVSGSEVFNYFSPRFGATYSLSARQVLRASVGRYVQQPETFSDEYRGAPFFGAPATLQILNRFYDPLGFLAVHHVVPQDSTNYDLSFEQELSQGLSAKITPFARVTRGQILSLPVNPLQPTFVTGYNFGAARVKGVEFLLRKNRQGEDGLAATLSATYTDSKIRFERKLGPNVIDVVNQSIMAYNAAHSTAFPLFDPNGYYSPSLVQAPGSTGPSYDVKWVANLNLDERIQGFDITPAFTYQSGNPYGDPLEFPDPTGLAGNGPDPYTGKFDGLGSLVGPSWVTMNLGVSHDLGKNIKASALWTNVFTAVSNHGYPWELPTNNKVLAYGDNSFYGFPLGLSGLTFYPVANPTTNKAYYGDNYYPYAPSSLIPAREFVFSLSTKL